MPREPALAARGRDSPERERGVASRPWGAAGHAVTTRAILVGGGPAPGIHAVIAAAPIGILGCQDGYRWRMRGDLSRREELPNEGLSPLHVKRGSVLRTSRANPTRSPGALRQGVETARGRHTCASNSGGHGRSPDTGRRVAGSPAGRR
jgi:hypothetical protein